MTDENKIIIEDLQSFYNYLLWKIQEYLLVADKNNSKEYFSKFLNLVYFNLLKS